MAIILLPLLACRDLLPPDPTLARRTRRALGILSLPVGSALIQPVSAEAQSVSVSNLSEGIYVRKYPSAETPDQDLLLVVIS